MSLYKQEYAGVPNGTLHNAITAQTDQTYIGDVLNYPVQSGQLTAITGRTFADLLDVEVTPFVTNLGTIQDYTVTVQYDSVLNSDFLIKFGGDDNANCYAAQIRRQNTDPQIALWKLTGGTPAFLTSVQLTISPPTTRTVVIRHEPTGITLDLGGSGQAFFADTSYPNPAGKKLFWFIGTAVSAGTGLHVTSIDNTAPDSVKPVITNNSPTPYKWPVGQLPYVPPNVTAEDNLDGDITDKIVQGGDTVDPLVKGSYFKTYNVIDSADNAADQLTLEIRVQDPVNIPTVFPAGAYPIVADFEASNCTAAQDIGTLSVLGAFTAQNLTVTPLLTEPQLRSNFIVDDMTVAPLLTEPTFTQAHVLAVDDMLVTPDLTPSSFKTIIQADDLTVAPDLTSVQFRTNMVVDDMTVAPLLNEPSLIQAHILSVDDMTVAPLLTQSNIGGVVVIEPDDLTVATVLSESSIELLFEVDSMTVISELTNVDLTQAHVLQVEDLTVTPILTNSGGVAIACIEGRVKLVSAITGIVTIN